MIAAPTGGAIVEPNTKKNIFLGLGIIGMPTALAFADWQNFFPLSVHSDLRFQLIGESLEALVVFGISAAFFIAVARRQIALAPRPISVARKILYGMGYVVMLLAMSWRSFFHQNQFDFGAGVGTLVGSLVAGLFLILFAFNSQRSSAKPGPEHEKSVV